MPSFFDLQKYAATGIAATDMSAYDKARALAAFGGGKTQTLTDVPPLSFKANGKPLLSWSMLGNGSQTGTPTPEDPIEPEFVGTLSGANWTIPITCAGQTSTVYLGEVPTVRQIKKLVLTGEENILDMGNSVYSIRVAHRARFAPLCTHYVGKAAGGWNTIANHEIITAGSSTAEYRVRDDEYQTLADFKAFLAQQYANGTPVTVWYVLANEQTGIVNEPLCKIGNYADELHSEDAGVTIPTVKGDNTLTVEGDLPPSSMTITYKG